MCSVGALRVTKITTGAAIWEVKTTSSVTSSRTYSKIFARSTWSTDLIEPERIIFTSPYLRMRNEPFCRGRSSVLVIFALVCRYSVILFYLDRVSSSVKTWLWIEYRKNILIQALVFHTAFSFLYSGLRLTSTMMSTHVLLEFSKLIFAVIPIGINFCQKILYFTHFSLRIAFISGWRSDKV